MQAIAENEVERKKALPVIKLFTRARDWIRTSTSFRTLPPQSSASTNFATRADCLKFHVRSLRLLTSNPKQLGLQI